MSERMNFHYGTVVRKIFSNALVAVVVITMGSFGIRVAILFL